MSTVLVEPGVTQAKFAKELENWKQQKEFAERGWILLREDLMVPMVEIAMLAKVSTSSGSTFLPVVACAVRLTYDNYDLLPPSMTFIDVFTRQPSFPHTRAFLSTPEGPREVLIDAHPITGLPFLCLPGIREYHQHPQHSGDDWLLHRTSKEGSISTICERIWRTMTKNVIGLNVQLQALPAFPLQAQIGIRLAQGELEARPKAELEHSSK
jgi:hypothetical protein